VRWEWEEGVVMEMEVEVDICKDSHVMQCELAFWGQYRQCIFSIASYNRAPN